MKKKRGVAGVQVGNDECQELFVSPQSEVLDTSESGGPNAGWHIIFRPKENPKRWSVYFDKAVVIGKTSSDYNREPEVMLN